MESVRKQFIRLKRSACLAHSKRRDDYGRFICLSSDRQDTKIKWASDGREEYLSNDALEKTYIKLFKIKDISRKLKINDLVLTNAEEHEFFTGRIKEISEDRIYIWNQWKAGSIGHREPTGKYHYSWTINALSMCYIAVLATHEDEADGTACKQCKQLFKDSELKKGLEEELLCVHCFDDLYVECSECDTVVSVEESKKNPDGDILCEYCFDEKCSVCSDCEDVIWQDDVNASPDGDPYCSDCWNEHWTCCSHCGATVDYDHAATGTDRDTYCSECFSERFCNCTRCGDTIRNDDAHYDEDENGPYCADCRNGNHNNTEEVTHPSQIHDYEYRPDAVLKKNQWEDELYFGFELEVQHENPGKMSYDFVKFLEEEKVKDRFYLKHDRSIGSGFEIVSHPSTLRYTMKEMRMKKVIEWLKEKKFSGEENGKCGLHIHVSKDFFEDLDITKLRLFFKKNQKHLEKLSRRKIGTKSDSNPFHFCQFEEMDEKEIIGNCSQSGRYWALNTNSSRETVEFRLFRSTLDYKRFLGIMQFVEAVCKFVKVVGLTCFLYGEGPYKGNSWKLFTDWCKEQNKYNHMLDYMKEESLV